MVLATLAVAFAAELAFAIAPETPEPIRVMLNDWTNHIVLAQSAGRLFEINGLASAVWKYDHGQAVGGPGFRAGARASGSVGRHDGPDVQPHGAQRANR